MKTLLFTTVVFVLSSCGNATNNSDPGNGDINSSEETSSGMQPRSNKGELPTAASDFLRDYFNSQKIQKINHKNSPIADGTFIEVELSDGIEVDFDKNGNWVEINSENNRELPQTILPNVIQKYLHTHYNTIGITSIDKTSQSYELELTNDIEVYFDLSGNFLRETK